MMRLVNSNTRKPKWCVMFSWSVVFLRFIKLQGRKFNWWHVKMSLESRLTFQSNCDKYKIRGCRGSNIETLFFWAFLSFQTITQSTTKLIRTKWHLRCHCSEDSCFDFPDYIIVQFGIHPPTTVWTEPRVCASLVRVWTSLSKRCTVSHSEDHAWYIRIIKANKIHYFSTLFWCTTLHVSDRLNVHHLLADSQHK